MIIYQFPLNKIIFLLNIQKFIVRCNSMFICSIPVTLFDKQMVAVHEIVDAEIPVRIKEKNFLENGEQ